MELNKISLKQVLTFIQESVQEHAQIMKVNNDMLEEIMSTMPPSSARSAKLREIYAKNNAISKKNHELNSLHINILGLLRNNRQEFKEYLEEGIKVHEEVEEPSKIEQLNAELAKTKKQTKEFTESILETVASHPSSMEDALQLTIAGKMKLDSTHPYASNDEFLNEMLNYYESNELYEKCAVVVELQSNTKK